MRRYILSTILAVTMLFLGGNVVLATPYGGGSYSQCQYSTSCPVVTPPVIPPAVPPSSPPQPQTPPPATVTPPTTTPPSEIVISIPSIGEENPVSKVVVDVVIDVKTISSLTKEEIENGTIGDIALYAGDSLIGKTPLNNDGTATIKWDIIDYPTTGSLTVVVYSKDGEAIAKEDEPVVFVAGIQTIVDAEIARREGKTVDQIANENSPQVAGATAVKRSPSALSQVLGDTGSLGEIGKIANPIQLPKIVETVAVSFPFWVFLVLFALAIRLIWQSSREAISINKLRKIIDEEKEINEQKSAFVAIASHYLNTPLSIINSAADMFVSIDKVSTEAVASLVLGVSKLRETVKNLIESAQKSTAQITSTPQVVAETVAQPVFKSKSFILPIAGIALVLIATNTLLQVITTISLNGIELLAQIIVFLSIVIFFGLSIRSARLRKQEKEFTNHMLSQQTTLDTSRNQFIEEAANKLRNDTDAIFGTTLALKTFSSFKYLDAGLKQFQDSVYKFELVKNVDEGAIATHNITTIHLGEFINGVVDKNIQKINDKKLFIQDTIPDIAVSQNLLLFGFVLNTVLDNAIKFSKDGGRIDIEASEQNNKTIITVTDTGIGISSAKLNQLFSPFARGTSVMQYDYEGMGFSLFLSRLICTRLHAEISMESSEGKGTRVTIEIPTHAV